MRVRVQSAPIRGRTVTVLCPESVPAKLAVHTNTGYKTRIFGDDQALSFVRDAAMLASVHRDAVVFVRTSRLLPKWAADSGPGSDLLLCHHSLQLRRSDWKFMRNHLSTGKAHDMDVPRTPENEEIEPWSNDRADLDVRFSTAFVVASAPVFRLFATQCEIAMDGSGCWGHLGTAARDYFQHGICEDLGIQVVDVDAGSEWAR